MMRRSSPSARPAAPQDDAILRPAKTCWRVEPAERVAVLVDNAAYFEAVRTVLPRARHSIQLIGWNFDPRTRLGPPTEDWPTIGEMLNDIARDRPEVEIRLLIWDAASIIATTQDFFPQRARTWLDPRIRFHLDDRHPLGASHHQKILTIDDCLAFCSGGDFSVERWDSPDHLDPDPRRKLPSGEGFGPRHNLTAVIAGAAARALAEHARARWSEATGEPPPAPPVASVAIWPDETIPGFTDTPVAIVRTLPAYRGRAKVREGEALFLAAIAAARQTIYIENQYFASRRVADALAARLAEPDGPEILLICSPHSPNFFDSLTMDTIRTVLIHHIRRADRHGRLRILAPYTSGGHGITVHSKLMIVDDRFVRLGSSNINGRSMRLDTECDIAFEASSGDLALRRRIVRLRDGLIGHFLGCDAARFSRELHLRGSLAAAIEALDQVPRRRLREILSQTGDDALRRPPSLDQSDPEWAHSGRRTWKTRLLSFAALLVAHGTAAINRLLRRRR